MRAWRTVVPVLAVVVGGVIAGCGDTEPVTTQPSSTTAAAAPTSVDPAAGLWDPCTLPDSALSAAGLNTSTKEKDVAGVAFEGWKLCKWQDARKTYTFTAASGNHTLDEARNRTDYTGHVDTTVGSYKALQSRPVGAANDLACYLTIEVSGGIVDFSVGNRVSAKNAGDPCAEVHRLSEAFLSYLPRA
ncbi:DUF3558 domain-containing protein [Nocardia asteroides]|uniref:DUF3558 domain-containing protein n=1 Tax=Nocardia asteroides TaxID=1824 RepID=UPI00378ADFDC